MRARDDAGTPKKRKRTGFRVEIEFRTGEARVEKEKLELRRTKRVEEYGKRVFFSLPKCMITKDSEVELAFR